MTARVLSRVLLAWLVLTAVACVLVGWKSRVALGPMPAQDASAWALDALESRRFDGPMRPPPPSARDYHAPGPILVDAWYAGRRVARHVGTEDLATVVEQAAKAFADSDTLPRQAGWRAAGDASRRVRFTITIVHGEAPIWRGVPWIENLALVPMRSGLTLHIDGRRAWLSPDELRSRRADEGAVNTPLDNVRIGVEPGPLEETLAHQLGIPVEEARAKGRFRSFRASTISASTYPRREEVNARTLEEAAREGARFLLRYQLHDGRFTYIYDARTGSRSVNDYSLPRHAGSAFFLAEIDHLHDMPEAQAGARKAVVWELTSLVRACGAEGARCVVEGDRGGVGNAALLAIAAAELLAAGPDPLVSEGLRDLATFLRQQQRADGELMHYYDVASQRPIDTQGLYASGQAALALLRAHEVLGDARNLDAAKRILEYLTGPGWSFLGSRYFYSEEHWTCLAANELRGRADESGPLDFCRRWASYNRTMQLEEGQTPWAARGAYSVGPVVPPQFTPASSRTEAFISTWQLSRRNGIDDPELRAQVEAGLGLLLAWRWAPGPEHLFANPEGAQGGMPASPAELTTRNDQVQHACSAMSRWAKVLKDAETAPR